MDTHTIEINVREGWRRLTVPMSVCRPSSGEWFAVPHELTERSRAFVVNEVDKLEECLAKTYGIPKCTVLVPNDSKDRLVKARDVRDLGTQPSYCNNYKITSTRHFGTRYNLPEPNPGIER